MIKASVVSKELAETLAQALKNETWR